MASAFDEIFGSTLEQDIFEVSMNGADVSQLTDNIRALFDSLPSVPVEHIVDENVQAKIVNKSSSKAKRKHTIQQASISQHLNKLWVCNDHPSPGNRVAIIEFCSGKGRLSKMILDIADLKRQRNVNDTSAGTYGVNFSPIVLIDRTESRRDVLNSPAITESQQVKCCRLNTDIADVNLSSVEIVAESRHTCAVGKHLCGCATDLSLKCYCDHLQHHSSDKLYRGMIGSVTFAMCCHHLCKFDEYEKQMKKNMSRKKKTKTNN